MTRTVGRDQVGVPVLRQRWARVSFLHWRYEPSVIRRCLPDGFEPELIDGSAWLSLLCFSMEAVRPVGVPALPRVGDFPETNLRTYVMREDGRTSVHFLSLDAGTPLTLAAKPLLGLPYLWSTMSVQRHGNVLGYHCARRSDPTVGHHVVIRVGEPLTAEAAGLEHALVDRASARVRVGTRQGLLPVEHPPWQLLTAELERFEENLVEAAGLPAPPQPPLVRYSPGVSVTFGLPHLL
jgi:uncharacterized protein YqjF (DUF2071 family)